MTPEDKMLNLLGLSLRAGKLITGEEMTIKSIQKNEAVFVLCATDCST
ncbi:MAG: ribosomal L7Ae/L30e/S12e/Gadd45 family protein, partial [Trichococcus flocculiformis]